MADRYRETKVRKFSEEDNDNRRVFESTLYPKILIDSSDIFITSNSGDRLDLLADTFYNDVSLWWIIAQANGIGKGTLNIKPGLQLRIPRNIALIMADLETINKEG